VKDVALLAVEGKVMHLGVRDTKEEAYMLFHTTFKSVYGYAPW